MIGENMSEVRVYLHEWIDCNNKYNDSICLYHKDIGWLEYLDEDDEDCPCYHKSKKDLIEDVYGHNPEGAKEAFKKYGKITYLSDL